MRGLIKRLFCVKIRQCVLNTVLDCPGCSFFFVCIFSFSSEQKWQHHCRLNTIDMWATSFREFQRKQRLLCYIPTQILCAASNLAPNIYIYFFLHVQHLPLYINCAHENMCCQNQRAQAAFACLSETLNTAVKTSHACMSCFMHHFVCLYRIFFLKVLELTFCCCLIFSLLNTVLKSITEHAMQKGVPWFGVVDVYALFRGVFF